MVVPEDHPSHLAFPFIRVSTSTVPFFKWSERLRGEGGEKKAKERLTSRLPYLENAMLQDKKKLL